ncbi:MAG: radical SAM protein [Prevotellaceae bacterium]|jgi:radical SAM protein with 4Fe4S-binding SPASM domain|nr:radical SAM protein [Prevotellaceae bacterium]
MTHLNNDNYDSVNNASTVYSVRNINDFLYLSILPDDRCNFHCSYCYSAKGRSDRQLSFDKIKVILDYFIDNRRINETKLYITFLGGGEPMLSWKTVKQSIEYASCLAESQSIKPQFEIVTNGSLLSEDMLATFVKYKIQPRVSFEVLEKIQMMQRGMYKQVSENLLKMSEAELHPQVRSVITPANVKLIPEMVETLIGRFPAVDRYYFDPVTDKNIFTGKVRAENFFKQYISSFYEAFDIARSNDKILNCAMLQNLKTRARRYCHGDLCLTPTGDISICHRIASPAEKDYQHCVYGKITNEGKLRFDQTKFAGLIEEDIADKKPACQQCFLKWHCAGGCMVQNRTYPPEINEIVCRFKREFSTIALSKNLISKKI